jgi:hypothetical protein
MRLKTACSCLARRVNAKAVEAFELAGLAGQACAVFARNEWLDGDDEAFADLDGGEFKGAEAHAVHEGQAAEIEQEVLGPGVGAGRPGCREHVRRRRPAWPGSRWWLYRWLVGRRGSADLLVLQRA